MSAAPPPRRESRCATTTQPVAPRPSPCSKRGATTAAKEPRFGALVGCASCAQALEADAATVDCRSRRARRSSSGFRREWRQRGQSLRIGAGSRGRRIPGLPCAPHGSGLHRIVLPARRIHPRPPRLRIGSCSLVALVLQLGVLADVRRPDLPKAEEVQGLSSRSFSPSLGRQRRWFGSWLERSEVDGLVATFELAASPKPEFPQTYSALLGSRGVSLPCECGIPEGEPTDTGFETESISLNGSLLGELCPLSSHAGPAEAGGSRP